MPRVSIIIINYKEDGLLTSCLKSLEGQSFRDFEIVVVDNGSSDGSLNEIRGFLERSSISSLVKLIPVNSNLGFVGGNSEGLKYVEGEYIALLNNDTEPDSVWLEELVKAMDSSPEVGICASKLIAYGTDIIDSAGDGFSTSLKGFKRGEGEKISLYDKSGYIFGACAGAALYRRTMLDKIGFMDDDFFLIHEDTDLNFRAQLNGWRVLYVPTAIVHHKVRSSIGYMSDTAVYYTLRNSEFVRVKNIPLGLFFRCLPSFIVGIFTEFFYFVIKHRKVKLYFKAKKDAMKLLPKMLKKRKSIMKHRKTDNKYLMGMLTPVWQKDFLRSKIQKLLRH